MRVDIQTPQKWCFRRLLIGNKRPGNVAKQSRRAPSADLLDRFAPPSSVLGRLEHQAGGRRLALDGRFYDAIKVFDAILRLHPDDANALAWRGLARSSVGGQDYRAVQDFRDALKLDPNLRLAQIGYGLVGLAGSLEDIEKFASEHPDDEHALLCKAVQQDLNLQSDASLATLRELLSLNPSNQAALGALAVFQLECSHPLLEGSSEARSEGIEAAEKALRLNPYNHVAQRALCGLLNTNPYYITGSCPTLWDNYLWGAFHLPVAWRDPVLVAETAGYERELARARASRPPAPSPPAPSAPPRTHWRHLFTKGTRNASLVH